MCKNDSTKKMPADIRVHLSFRKAIMKSVSEEMESLGISKEKIPLGVRPVIQKEIDLFVNKLARLLCPFLDT